MAKEEKISKEELQKLRDDQALQRKVQEEIGKLGHNFTSREEWLTAINEAPNDSWMKSRSLGGNRKSTYIPIPVQQALADIFFDQFDVFDAVIDKIENEIICTVKINALPSYPNSDPRIISGTGACPIATDSGSPVDKFPKGKKVNALEYCVPKARTSAISNALETFANIFGRNLGRSVSANFSFIEKVKEKNEPEEPKKKKKKGKNKKDK